MLKTRIYIDGANLYKGLKSDTEELDYAKFYQYLVDKYKPEAIYLFTGRMASLRKIYDKWTEIGYHIIFKETFQNENGEIKGNVDAELIVKSLEEAYEDPYDQGVLVSGDGDFACLIDFWKRKNIPSRILIPKKEHSSYFLRKQNVPLVFLDHERLKPKITKPSKRKSP
jgi:uncharacterized LabA/DUF88 family protein